MPNCTLYKAFMNKCFPCNPLPFSIGLTNLIQENGTDFIKTDKAKALLWVLMSQAYEQNATIDLHSEWNRLEEIFHDN